MAAPKYRTDAQACSCPGSDGELRAVTVSSGRCCGCSTGEFGLSACGWNILRFWLAV